MQGVDNLDVLQFERAALGAQDFQLLFHLGGLLGFFQIILPIRLDNAVRMPFFPYSSEAVFYHIADDPIGREKLRRRRDALFGDLYILF